MAAPALSPRERFLGCLTGGEVDRPPFILWWNPWWSTWQRWRREGVPFADWQKLRRHYGSEPGPVFVPVHQGPWPPHPAAEQRVEEDERSYTFRDAWGILRRRLKDGMSMDAFLAFPVRSRADWEAYRREHLDPAAPGRLPDDLAAWARLPGVAVGAITLGGFPDVGLYGALRWLVGDEEACLLLYDDPDLVHEIMDHLVDLWLAVWERVIAAGVRVDHIHLWEDMCSCQGPLIGPEAWRRFMGPGYRRIAAFAAAHDIPLFSVDTDGRVELLLDPLRSHGVNALLPFEVAAGNDVAAIRRNHPDLGLIGGIDKRALARDRAAIDAELARIRPVIAAGRYLPTLDHLVPDDVPWEHMRSFIERLRAMVVAGG